MKNILKNMSLLAVGAMLSTSCIEETFPESSLVTADQLSLSADALESSLNGIPSQMCQWYYVYGSQVHETDMGYIMFPILDTELLGDIYPEGEDSGYDWFRSYNVSTGMGVNSYPAYLSWFSLYRHVKAANDILAAVDLDKATDVVKTFAGEALTCRALYYYQLMVHWEAFENIYTDCSKVAGLTVPIITEKTTGEEATKTERATHAEMVAFILNDLKQAETLMLTKPSSLSLPSLACVYGMMARVYMWDEDYANAAVYARKAIDTHGGAPVTKAQWLDLNTGFNTSNQAWMWRVSYDPENMANLCNWTGWMSSEADWGYSSLTKPAIDRRLYDHINYTDFRKQSYLDPDRTKFEYETCRDQKWLDDQPDYLSLKFRCVNGDWETYTIGGACEVPIMRVEEFYLIEAEAVGASKSVAEGVNLLTSFMTQYRDPAYVTKANDLDALQKEVLTQMRIEFWGEGTAFASAKRLRVGVMQNYDGTNAPADIYKLNCKGIKPNWNFMIPQDEIDAHPNLEGKNNPDPSKVIITPCAVNEYAPANF